MPACAVKRHLPTVLVLAGAILTGFSESARPVELLVEFPIPPEAPELSLDDVEGRRFSLGDYRGRVVLVHFWAIWCAPCREELPAMNRALDALTDRDVVILAVNMGDPPERVRAFLNDHPVRFAVLIDQGGEAAGRWQVQGLPTTYVILPDGTIHGGALGARSWDHPDLLGQILALADTTD